MVQALWPTSSGFAAPVQQRMQQAVLCHQQQGNQALPPPFGAPGSFNFFGELSRPLRATR